MAIVHFLDLQRKYRENHLAMLDRLLQASAGLDMIKDGAPVAVKTHFGEDGNLSFVSPLFVRRIVDAVRAAGGKPFLTETTTLYSGRRFRGDTHLELAREHGFDFAPIMIADGLYGDEFDLIENCKIGRTIARVDTIVCVSHFKGHLNTGFGGALKNLGMGCASKGGKLELHSNSKPFIDQKKCTACQRCIRYCAFGAIALVSGKVTIDKDKCTGCTGCMAICPEHAIRFRWDAASADIQQRIARYAAAVTRNRRSFFVNFLINIAPNCDCFHTNEPMIHPDVGILCGTDPVALDQACFDMVRPAIEKLHPDLDCQEQLAQAARLGGGERKYEIKTI